MRALKITLFLITATLFQTPIVHAADHRTPHHQVSYQPHLHHLEARHSEHLVPQPSSQETIALPSPTFSLAAYIVGLLLHNR